MLFLVSTWDEFEYWLKHGGKNIVIIAILAFAAYLVFRAVFPHVLRTAVLRGRSAGDEEIERRIETLSAFANRIAGTVAFIVAGITILPEAGVDITAIVAGFSLTGLAIALGAQPLVRDAINGMFLLAEDQYRKGDVIKIADITGTVEDITLRRTIVRDEDGVVHSVPNGSIAVVSNFTREFAQVNVPFTIVYLNDLPKALELIESVGRDIISQSDLSDQFLEQPMAGRVQAIGDKGVTVTVTARTKPAARWDAAAELRRRLAEASLRIGLRVPFPVEVEEPSAETTIKSEDAGRT